MKLMRRLLTRLLAWQTKMGDAQELSGTPIVRYFQARRCTKKHGMKLYARPYRNRDNGIRYGLCPECRVLRYKTLM